MIIGGLNMVEMNFFRGLVHIGNPKLTSHLTRTFWVPLVPFPGLKMIFPGDVELIVETVTLDTTKVKTVNGEITVRFKDEIYDCAEMVVQELLNDGWYDIEELQ